MEYHAWRNIEPETNSIYEEPTVKRNCGICRLLKKKKAENYPIRMIKSVTSWWWFNNHDSQCLNITDSEIPEYFSQNGLLDPPVSMKDNWFEEGKFSLPGSDSAATEKKSKPAFTLPKKKKKKKKTFIKFTTGGITTKKSKKKLKKKSKKL